MSEEEISQSDENQTQNNNNKESKSIKYTDSSNVLEISETKDKNLKKTKKNGNKIKNNSNNMKVFEKYHNLSIKELHILLSQKNDDLIRLNEEKEKSKKVLSDLINKINNTISLNYEYLFSKEEDEDLLLNLEKTKEDKKKQLENIKKLNILFKEQLSKIKDKITNNEKEKKRLGLIDNKIDALKKKNILLKKEINEIKNKKVLQDKELEIISENKKYPLKIKIKTEEMNNFASQKHDYFSKLSMSMKSLENIFKEIKRFDEMYNSSITEDTDENIVKNINFWINLIKKDLSGDKNEILARIENDKSQFLNEIKNRNEINNNNNTIGNDTFSIGNTLNNNTEENTMKNYDAENNIIKNKNKIIINKNKSTSLLYSNFNKHSNNLQKNRLYNLTNSGNNLDHKTLFKKLNYLKVSTPGNGMKLKLKNISNLNNYLKGNYCISEEINDSVGTNNNSNYLKNECQNATNYELNDILSKDYSDINDKDYRELLNKKEQYLESNLRLEKNIIEIKKAKNKKISNILKSVRENVNNLENIKKKNDLIEKEINNLYNIFQLTIEQAKLKNEINYTNNNKKKKLKLRPEPLKNEENKLFKSSEKIPKNQNLEDILIPKKKRIKSIETDNNIKKIKNETREEQLKKIREKYKDGNIELIEKDNNNIINNDNINNFGDDEQNSKDLNYNIGKKSDIINDEDNNDDDLNNINNEKENNEKEKVLI